MCIFVVSFSVAFLCRMLLRYLDNFDCLSPHLQRLVITCDGWVDVWLVILLQSPDRRSVTPVRERTPPRDAESPNTEATGASIKGHLISSTEFFFLLSLEFCLLFYKCF